MQLIHGSGFKYADRFCPAKTTFYGTKIGVLDNFIQPLRDIMDLNHNSNEHKFCTSIGKRRVYMNLFFLLFLSLNVFAVEPEVLVVCNTDSSSHDAAAQSINTQIAQLHTASGVYYTISTPVFYLYSMCVSATRDPSAAMSGVVLCAEAPTDNFIKIINFKIGAEVKKVKGNGIKVFLTSPEIGSWAGCVGLNGKLEAN